MLQACTQNRNSLLKYCLAGFASLWNHPTAWFSDGNPRNLLAMFSFENSVTCLQMKFSPRWKFPYVKQRVSAAYKDGF